MKIKIRSQKAPLSLLCSVLEKTLEAATGDPHWVDVMQEDDHTLIVTAMNTLTGTEVLGPND